MRLVQWCLFLTLLMHVAMAAASTKESDRVLRVYGPGGPHHVIEECAAIFQEQHGINVQVVRALPHNLELRLREDGDLYYGGAEYMLEGFDRRNPGVLDMASVENLHPRRIGIVVRKGNPLSIDGVEDLKKNKIGILDVKLENMRHFHGDPSVLSNNVQWLEYTGKQGTEAWLKTPRIDAWVTYKTWHLTLQEESDFIEIPGEIGVRFTPMALTQRTQNKEEANQFIAFLKSTRARQIFEQHGWY
jgi:accessory colonization factor AcfC